MRQMLSNYDFACPEKESNAPNVIAKCYSIMILLVRRKKAMRQMLSSAKCYRHMLSNYDFACPEKESKC